MTLAILGGEPVGSTEDHRVWPTYDEADIEATAKALRSERYGFGSPLIQEAEAALADYFGAKFCLLVTNATEGLTAAQAAVGVGPGDEVIQPAYSFVASPQSTLRLGAHPVFYDIRPDTLTLDPALIGSVGRRTRALMPVAMHGLITDVEQIDSVAKRLGLPVVWDNAQAAGATSGGYTAGTTGDVAVISLHTKKILCTDQGGVILTDDEGLYRSMRRYAHYGMESVPGKLPSYYTPDHGANLAPTSQVAALVLSRLPKLAATVETVTENMRVLMGGLRGLPGLALPTVPEGDAPTRSRPRIGIDAHALGWRWSPIDLRDRIATALRAEGLPVRSWMEWPLPAQPAFRREVTFGPSSLRVPGPVLPWQPRAYRVTSEMLASSVMIGDDPWPIWAQSTETMGHYVSAFRKVWSHMDAVMEAEFPVTRPEPRPAL